MNKLEMAHEYAVAMLKAGVTKGNAEDFAQTAFDLVDAMHKENNKRYKLDINKILKDHEHVFIEGVICWCGKTKSDFEGEQQDSLRSRP